MLNKIKSLVGFTLNGLDGEIGTVKEFYFDDQHWAIRYLIAETGDWLSDRQVLISPYALIKTNKKEQHFDVNLTKKQIEESPAVSNDKPVSRQFEDEYYQYYGWPIYYGGPHMWGGYPTLMFPRGQGKKPDQPHKAWDPHLRSTEAVGAYYIQAIDGEIGHVEDFILDEKPWAIRYLIINTRNWWPGKKVLVSPQWIDRISSEEEKVFIDLSLETIKKSPEFTDDFLVTRDYETKLHQHYNRPGYWIDMPNTCVEAEQ
jgi:uncharacterized protein YrrD